MFLDGEVFFPFLRFLGAGVMSLTLIKSIFFIQIGFVIKTVLITHQCLVSLWAVACTASGFSYFLRGFVPTQPLQHVKWGIHRRLAGDETSTADLNWPKECFMPNGIMVSNKILGKRWRNWRSSWSWHLFFQVITACAEALFRREGARYLPANRKQWINSLFCFPCTQSFTSLIKLSWSILSFLFWFLLLSCWEQAGSKQLWGCLAVVLVNQPKAG